MRITYVFAVSSSDIVVAPRSSGTRIFWQEFAIAFIMVRADLASPWNCILYRVAVYTSC